MSEALPLPPPGFEALSTDDKIDLRASLWDRIAARPGDVNVQIGIDKSLPSDWHRIEPTKIKAKSGKKLTAKSLLKCLPATNNEAPHLRPRGGAKTSTSFNLLSKTQRMTQRSINVRHI